MTTVRRYTIADAAELEEQPTTGQVVRVLWADGDARGVSVWTLEADGGQPSTLQSFCVGTGIAVREIPPGLSWIGTAKVDAPAPLYFHVWAAAS